MYPQYEQDKQLVKCHPSFRQIMINQMEFYVFAHFGVNTFTDREWGDGTEDPAIFNPTELDARQWAAAVKSAGAKAMLLTCKRQYSPAISDYIARRMADILSPVLPENAGKH